MAASVQITNPRLPATGARCERHAVLHENKLRKNFIEATMISQRLDANHEHPQTRVVTINTAVPPNQLPNFFKSTPNESQTKLVPSKSATSSANNSTISRSSSTISKKTVGVTPIPSRLSVDKVQGNSDAESRISNNSIIAKETIAQLPSSELHEQINKLSMEETNNGTNNNNTIDQGTSASTYSNSMNGCMGCGKNAGIISYTCNNCANNQTYENNNNSTNQIICEQGSSQINQENSDNQCCDTKGQKHNHFSPHVNVRQFNMLQGTKLGFRPLVAGLGKDKNGLTEPWTSSKAKIIRSKVCCTKKTRDSTQGKIYEPIGGYMGNNKNVKSVCSREDSTSMAECQSSCENELPVPDITCPIDQSPVCAGITLPCASQTRISNTCSCTIDSDSDIACTNNSNKNKCCATMAIPCPPKMNICPPMDNTCSTERNQFNTISMIDFAFDNDTSLTITDMDYIISKSTRKRDVLLYSPNACRPSISNDCSMPCKNIDTPTCPKPCYRKSSVASNPTSISYEITEPSQSCSRNSSKPNSTCSSRKSKCKKTISRKRVNSCKKVSKCSTTKKISKCSNANSCKSKSRCFSNKSKSTCGKSKSCKKVSKCASTKSSKCKNSTPCKNVSKCVSRGPKCKKANSCKLSKCSAPKCSSIKGAASCSKDICCSSIKTKPSKKRCCTATRKRKASKLCCNAESSESLDIKRSTSTWSNLSFVPISTTCLAKK